MDEQQRKVFEDLTRAEKWAATLETAREVADVAKYVPFLTATVLAAEAMFLSDEQKHQMAAVRTGREQYDRWTKVRRPWAESGIRSTDNKPYSVTQWLEEGNANGKQLASALKYLWDDMPIVVTAAYVEEKAEQGVKVAVDVAEAVGEGAKALGEAVTDPWPWYVKAAMGAVAVTALGVGAGYAVRSFRRVAP